MKLSLLAVGCLFLQVSGNGNSSMWNATNDDNDDDNSTSGAVTNCTSLSFFLLGDWGKGGTSGAYGSAHRKQETDGGALRGLESSPSEDESEGTVSESYPRAAGQQKTYYQLAVAKAMSLYAEAAVYKPSFVVALGDNFYSNGVSSATDELWSHLWKNVYLLPYPQLNIPWYPVFGNHDYGGSTSAQIQRTTDHTDDDIWSFEGQYYMKQFAIPGPAGGSVVIVFIDTTTLAPSQTKYTNANGGISSAVQAERIAEQLTFINESLASVSGANRPTWLFVAGHYPVYSSGDHGDTSELSVNLLPLLQYYEVDAYFCGHDHISEHLQYGGVGTHFFVAGAGSMTDSLKKQSVADLLWYGVGYSSFAAVNVTASNFTVQFVDALGDIRYSHTVVHPSMADTETKPTSSPSVLPTIAAPLTPSQPPTATPSEVGEGVPSRTSDNMSSLDSFVRSHSTSIVITGSALIGLAALLVLGFVLFGGRRVRGTAAGHKKKADGKYVSMPNRGSEDQTERQLDSDFFAPADQGPEDEEWGGHNPMRPHRSSDSQKSNNRSSRAPQSTTQPPTTSNHSHSRKQSSQETYNERWAPTPDSVPSSSSCSTTQRELDEELRLKLFDVIASSIREADQGEAVPVSSRVGRTRAGPVSGSSQQHKRASTLAV